MEILLTTWYINHLNILILWSQVQLNYITLDQSKVFFPKSKVSNHNNSLWYTIIAIEKTFYWMVI
jgi:hypothetical protein